MLGIEMLFFGRGEGGFCSGRAFVRGFLDPAALAWSARAV